MEKVLIVADTEATRKEFASALGSLPIQILETDSGRAVRNIVAKEEPDVVVIDMQVGSMGGVAIAMDLRLEETGDRVLHSDLLLVLDRRPDVFLAKRAGVEGYIVKPFDALRLRRAVRALLNGDTFYDDSYAPEDTLSSAF